MDTSKKEILFPNNLEFNKYLIPGDKTKIADNLGCCRNYIYKILGGYRRMTPKIQNEILRFKKINEEYDIDSLKCKQTLK